MAFRFSLQALLRLRQSYERRERLLLESLAQQLAQVRHRIEALEQAGLAAQQRLVQDLEEGMAGSEIHFEAASAGARAQRHSALMRQLAELEQRHRRQQIVFRRAQQQREILENLRDRYLDVYRQTQRRREQQQLDDLFLMRRGIGPRS